MAYVLVDVGVGHIDYPADTDEEIAAAVQALRDAGQAWAHVWLGCPDDPDTYVTSRVLWAVASPEEVVVAVGQCACGRDPEPILLGTVHAGRCSACYHAKR